MNVLIIGSGGREHALAWKIAQSTRVSRLWVAPGNGGTEALSVPGGNVPIQADDIPGLVRFAQENDVDTTIVGPEVPLAAGLADAFGERRLPVFGPSGRAARIEASKAFAKEFMRRHGIPTARYATFGDFDDAVNHTKAVDYPIVIKASGLAAGKGVLLPNSLGEAESSLHRIMVERAFGVAGDEVVIEERLSGPEISVLAFSDGETLAVMQAAADHKRAYDGDQGPNTGGMGAYAPTPFATPSLLDEVQRVILQPTINGMSEEGTPYLGVLYAGIMLTDDGPKVLEFNCRFGDPETQVILPLLETDLLDVVEACIEGNLDALDVIWKSASAATIVLASGGYPGSYEKGYPIAGLEATADVEGVVVFHAGTRRNGAEVLTNGGRVLNVTAVGESLGKALGRAYATIEKIHFDDMHYRYDIGAGAS